MRGSPERATAPVPRPWYREPWPWVLIAIPALAVVGSAVTLWLALRHPDTLVLDVERYREIRAGLRAEQQPGSEARDATPAPASSDGER